MTIRLTLLCAAATASSRTGAFPSPDEPLDEGGLRKAQSLGLRGPSPDIVLSSTSRGAIETARTIGIEPRIEPLLADLDCGDWSGRMLEEVHTTDSDGLNRWIADPASPISGGEAMDDVVRRVGTVIERLVIDQPRSVLVVAHASTIRAAIVHTLALPISAAMRIDVAPLGSVILSWHRQWRLQELRLPKAG